MGHCIGLGHIYFHRGSALHTLFEGNDLIAYNSSFAKYDDSGAPNVDSMMAYAPTSFPNSPRVKRVCHLCSRSDEWDQATRDNLAVSRGELQKLRDLRVLPEAQGFGGKFDVATRIPPKFRQRNIKFKVGGHLQGIRVRTYEELRSLDPADLQGFLGDITIIQAYWLFAPAS